MLKVTSQDFNHVSLNVTMPLQGVGFGTGKAVYASCRDERAQKALTPAPRSSVTEAAGREKPRKDARLLPKGKTLRPFQTLKL